MPEILYIANDNLLKLTGLKDARDGSTITGASIDVTIQDRDGNDIAGQAWPTPMTEDPNSAGDYYAVLDAALQLAGHPRVTAVIDATSGSIDGHWEVPCRVQVRTS